jgi:methyl halide transferase
MPSFTLGFGASAAFNRGATAAASVAVAAVLMNERRVCEFMRRFKHRGSAETKSEFLHLTYASWLIPFVSETDWEVRYQTGDMPWEKGEASPGLVDFLTAHPDLPKGRVLVPGCGTGHDARAWAKAGFDVTGLDLAPSAIRLSHERTEAAGLKANFHLGNFLEDKPLAQFDWVFEHTLFCAIDRERRDDYARAILRWLKPAGQFLAVHYMIRENEGPPFGCTQAELMERFAPHFTLRQGWVPRSYPNRTGLELMLWWQRQPGT